MAMLTSFRRLLLRRELNYKLVLAVKGFKPIFIVNLTFMQIDLVLTIEEMLEFMHLRHRFVIKESEELYPNAVETLLPNWLKGSKDNVEWALMAEDDYEKPDKVRRWIAKRYAKWAISDDYSASGVKICNRIEKAQVCCYNKVNLIPCRIG